MPPPPVAQKGSWPKLGKFWTLPNVLSLARFVLAVPLCYMIVVDAPLSWLMTVFLVAVATDFFDGKIARWSKAVSDWGKVLDPLADKFGAGMVMLGLVIRQALPWWLLVLIVVRDTLIVSGGILLGRRTGLVLMSMWWGKVAVAALAVTAFAALPQVGTDPPVLQACIWITTGLMVYSFLLYIVRYIRLSRTVRERDALIATLPGAAGDAGVSPANSDPSTLTSSERS